MTSKGEIKTQPGCDSNNYPQAICAGKLIGEPLNANDFATLARSWITPELAEIACIRRVAHEEGRELVAGKAGRDYSGIVFPYFLPGKTQPHSFRLRRDNCELDQKGNELEKYLSAGNSQNRLYFIPGENPNALTDVSLPVLLVEGEKKALALSRLASYDAASPRFLVVAVAGVWNWKGKTGKDVNSNGKRVDVRGPIPDLDLIDWKGRPVYIVFDSDVHTNWKVRAARIALARELAERGAKILLTDLPESPRKLGIDDYLCSHGAEAALRLFEEAEELSLSRFQLRESGVWWMDPDREHPKDVWVCSWLEITALTRDNDAQNWGRLLSFQDPEDKMHFWAMPMELLAGDGNEYRRRLLSEGLRIGTRMSARDKLAEYLQSSLPKRKVRCVPRLGWFGNTFVLPDTTIGEVSGERVIYQTDSDEDHFYRCSGSLGDWQQNVAQLCSGNSSLTFSVAVAFAGPLLDISGQESGGFNWVGDSSTGKSTALMACGSVWGGGGRLGFCNTWRATANGLEAIAELHNDVVLCLDEIAQVDPREAGEIAYLLANGIGKLRMTRSIAARRKPTWRLLFLSSGEIPLAEHIRSAGKRVRGGQEVRLLELPADAGAGLGLFEDLHGFDSGDSFAKALTRNAKKYYGVAGRKALEFLVSNRERVAEAVRRHQNHFIQTHVPKGASGEISRAAGRFALVAAAGELASEAGITGWNEHDAEKAAIRLFKVFVERRTLRGGDEEAAIRQVRQFLEAHGSS
ncbi:MAG: DUF927 domain-containing protein, partial [Terriglobia bacterium]